MHGAHFISKVGQKCPQQVQLLSEYIDTCLNLFPKGPSPHDHSDKNSPRHSDNFQQVPPTGAIASHRAICQHEDGYIAYQLQVTPVR